MMRRKHLIFILLLVAFILISNICFAGEAKPANLRDANAIALKDKEYKFSNLFIAASIASLRDMTIEEVMEVMGEDNDWERATWLLTNSSLTAEVLVEGYSKEKPEMVLTNSDINRLRKEGYLYKDILKAGKLSDKYGETIQFILWIKDKEGGLNEAENTLRQRASIKKEGAIKDQFVRLLDEYFGLSTERKNTLCKVNSPKEVVQALYIAETYGTSAEEILSTRNSKKWVEIIEDLSK